MNYWAHLLNPGVLAMLIPIAAILSGTVVSVLKHRERMAMIERGMDPDGLKKAKLALEAREDKDKEREAPRLERR